MAARKKKATVKHSASREHKLSPIIQFAVVFVILAAMALVAFTYKNYL